MQGYLEKVNTAEKQRSLSIAMQIILSVLCVSAVKNKKTTSTISSSL
jgi:uncharacterized membrane protein YhfC